MEFDRIFAYHLRHNTPSSRSRTLLKANYTPEVFSARVATNMARINRVANTSWPRMLVGKEDVLETLPLVAGKEDPLDFQVPGQTYSFRSLISFTKKILGIEDIAVTINITEEEDNYVARIRVIGGPYDGSTEEARIPIAINHEHIVIKVATAAMRSFRPCVLANHLLFLEAERCRSSPPCDFDVVIDIFNEVLSSPPERDDKWAHLGLGKVFMHLEEEQKAVEEFREAIEQDLQFANAYAYLSECLLELGQETEGIAAIEKAAQLDPANAFIYDIWGRALSKTGKPEEALDKFAKASSIDPKSLAIYNNWGSVLTKLERYEEAIEKYKKASDLDKKSVIPLVNWGLAIASSGRNKEAIKYFEKASQVNPNVSPTYISWGRILKGLGHVAEGIEKYKKALEVEPESWLAYCAWGDALESLHEFEGALKKYDTAIEIKPRSSLAWSGKGSVLFSLKRYEEA